MNSQISLVQPLLGLLFVLLAMGATLWILRKLQDKKNIFGGKSIQIIEAASVGTRERIVVASVDNRRLVLGVTAQQVNFLVELDSIDPETGQSTSPDKGGQAGASGSGNDFQSSLRTSIERILPSAEKKD